MTVRHPRYPDTPKECRALLRAQRSTKALGVLDLEGHLVLEDKTLQIGWAGEVARGRHLRALLDLPWPWYGRPNFDRDWLGRFKRRQPTMLRRGLVLDRRREP